MSRMLGGGLAASLPTPGGLTLDELPRLHNESELQKLLSDEKMRAEQHRTNYQTLKTEHTRLQDEYVSLQTELKSTIEESKLVQEKYQGLLEHMRKELSSKHTECEQLKSQAMTSQKLEMLKLQMTEEIEKPFRTKYAHLDEEVDKYRNEYNKVKYEYSFLKAEYEHEKQESQKILDEMKLRHEAEVTNLRRDRETQAARQTADPSSDSQRLRVLQRENAQLHLKQKGLLTELEEIRAQREHVGMQADNVSRLQTKQLAEHAANVKALETERESLRLQCDTLQKELTSTNDLQTQLTARIHELEKENIVLKNRSEETAHKAKVDLTNLKMEALRERGELERDRDRLKNDIEDVKAQLEIANHGADKQEVCLQEKEREGVQRVQAAREEEWQKLHQVEAEKMELETRLQELSRRKIDEEAQQQADRERVDDRMRTANDAREAAEKEVLVVKTKLQHQQGLGDHLERERTENSQLKTRLHRIETQYHSYVSSEQELADLNDRLKGEVGDLTHDLQKTREKMKQAQNDLENVTAQNRASWMEEKVNLQKRVEELDDQLSLTHNKLTLVLAAKQKKSKKAEHVVSRLKQKMTLQRAKIEELEIHKEALQKSVAPQTHEELRKKMNDLLRKHRNFRHLFLTPHTGGELQANNTIGSINLDGSNPFNNWTLLEDQYQKDFELVKERMQNLGDNQRHQMDELKGVSPISTPAPTCLHTGLVDQDSLNSSEKENL